LLVLSLSVQNQSYLDNLSNLEDAQQLYNGTYPVLSCIGLYDYVNLKL